MKLLKALMVSALCACTIAPGWAHNGTGINNNGGIQLAQQEARRAQERRDDGGGWTQPPLGLYVKIGQYSIVADSYFTPAGDVVDITTTGFHATSLYAEYGISKRLTAIVYFPFFVRSTLNRVETPDGTPVQGADVLNGVGDAELSIKYSLLKKGPYALAARLTLGLPLGNPAGGNTELLQSGDGEFNQMLIIEGSRSFSGGRSYASVHLGVNNRTQGFSDELRYGIEGGVKAGQRTWIILRMHGIESFMNGNAEVVANNGIFSNNIEFLSFSPEVAYNVTKTWGLSAGFGGAFFGRQVLAAPALQFGIFGQW